jgi:hypothetical protein
MHSISHCATAVCDAPASVAFAVLADPARLGTWALGCWGTEAAGEGVVRGTSLFDGSQAYVRADADRARLGVDFSVGDEPDRLVHRLSARVLPGGALGYGDERCLVTLLAWRPEDMPDDRWVRLATSHETEILLLRARIEESA